MEDRSSRVSGLICSILLAAMGSGLLAVFLLLYFMGPVYVDESNPFVLGFEISFSVGCIAVGLEHLVRHL